MSVCVCACVCACACACVCITEDVAKEWANQKEEAGLFLRTSSAPDRGI